MKTILAMVFVVLMAACGGAGEGPDGGSVPGGPVVSALTSSAPTITDGESITFTAVVTDPDGQSDITLGRLEDTTGNVHYGDFAPSGDNEFTITLDWDAIHRALAIEFVAAEARVFRAEFIDGAGHVGTRDVSIQLACGAQPACAGSCVDTDSADADCGECGKDCPVTDGLGGCQAGACLPALGECTTLIGGETCAAICAAAGAACAAAACGGETAFNYDSGSSCVAFNSNGTDNDACNEPLPGAFAVVRCCCTVP